jgi:hypothetical protein
LLDCLGVSQVGAIGDARGKAVALALAVAAVGVIALFVLIARELFASRRIVATEVPHETAPVLAPSATLAPAAQPPPVTGAIAHARSAPPTSAAAEPAPAPAPPTSAAPLAPRAARAIADVIANPRSVPIQVVTQNRRNHTETYAYDRLPPFLGSDLTRDKTNADAWDLNVSRGPGLEELAPRGGIHEAFVQKDDHGDPFATWYAIDTGPLAPAYAIQQGDRTRVISRPYLEANRADFPPSVMSNVDR